MRRLPVEMKENREWRQRNGWTLSLCEGTNQDKEKKNGEKEATVCFNPPCLLESLRET